MKQTVPIAATERKIIYTKRGEPLLVSQGSEHPVSYEDAEARRQVLREKNKHLLAKTSVDQFIAEKRRDAEAGLL